MPKPNLAVLDARGILSVAGPDRRSFLQGLVSNDVTKIARDRAIYAALLTAQGRYLHDFVMVEADEAIWLDTEQARLADLKRRLAVYRLRAKVELQERPDLVVAAVFGDGAAAALELPAEAGAARSLDGGSGSSSGVAIIDPRLAALGGRIVIDRARIAEAAVQFTHAAATDYDRHRLSFGIPDGSRDLVPEKSLLLEAGLDELQGIDWQKGCYVGQELTARTKYRGLVKRRLFPVHIEGPAPAPGTALAADGREIGEMRSSRGGLGLALLRLDAVALGRPFAVGNAQLTPFRLAWMPELGA